MDTAPTLVAEERIWQEGFDGIAGLDEAGRGALAGPVVAAAVVLPTQAPFAGVWRDVRDSKLLRPAERESLAALIRQEAAGWGIGEATAQEIDRFGIAPATRLAMARALASLPTPADYLLIDWVRLPQVNLPQESFAKGDRRIVSIAAASILAKTRRDAIMVALESRYPGYDLAAHKGYGTPTHLSALARLGPSPEHRHSFAPLRTQPSLFDPEPPKS